MENAELSALDVRGAAVSIQAVCDPRATAGRRATGNTHAAVGLSSAIPTGADEGTAARLDLSPSAEQAMTTQLDTRPVLTTETPPVAAPRVVTMIEPPRGWQWLNLRELWLFRELVFFLAWRDVKVRYKQTVLGAAWAVLQPAMMMVVFTILFHKMAASAPRTAIIPIPNECRII